MDPDGYSRWQLRHSGTTQYPFDPTVLINGVGYVWHCHIVDHEDNEMMRPYVLKGLPRQ